jgi:hypothetical protein
MDEELVAWVLVEKVEELLVARQAWRMVGEGWGWRSVLPPEIWVMRRSIILLG